MIEVERWQRQSFSNDNESRVSNDAFFVERRLVEAPAKTKKPLKIKGFFFSDGE